jgi:hypothetical protein
VRWWFPGRYFGLAHHSVSPEWKREMFEMRDDPDLPHRRTGRRPET